MSDYKLLTKSNMKTMKGEGRGYITFILHLSPYDVGGHGNVCPKATAGCIASCLNTAGRGGMFRRGETTNTVQEARKRRTGKFFEDRAGFMSDLFSDISRGIRYAEKKGFEAVFRLNGTSDLSWEKYRHDGQTVFERFSGHQFYDYTKVLGRKVGHIPNYHLTFSKSDGNDVDVAKAMKAGMNVAVVFGGELPDEYLGRRVVSGDDDDLRFLDPADVIVGLTAKGRAKKDVSGFVVR